MKNRYEEKPEELENVIKDMLNVKEGFLEIDPTLTRESYFMGHLAGIREILESDCKQYAKYSEDDLDRLIFVKGGLLKDAVGDPELKDREFRGFYNGYVQAYDDLFKLGCGNDFDVLGELESSKGELAKHTTGGE